MKIRLLSFAFLSLLFLVYSCKNEPLEVNQALYSDTEWQVIEPFLDLPEASLDYTLTFPSYYRTSAITTNNELATLGRVIFYDKNLSKDKSISCASCHKQELAFSDDLALSEGIEGRQTDRNSLALGAVFSFSEYYGRVSSGRIPFMWDNRAESVAEQSEMTFKNNREMGMEMHQVVDRMSELAYYPPLVKKAYGFDPINGERVLEALDAFVNSMGSVSSRFDKEVEKVSSGSFSSLRDDIIPNFAGFTQQENLGKSLFINNCSSCHGRVVEPAQTIAENNGLEMNYEDQGLGRLPQGVASDNGKFKVPTVRNITLTAPYMHDGRFSTLDEVLDHYSTGIVNHPNLSPELKTISNPKRFNFTAEEKEAIIAFFHTLEDEKYTSDERFSDPFKQ